MAVINISRNGTIEDGGSTKNQRTSVKTNEIVRWNSRGNGPWSVVFTGEDTPLLETTGGNPPLPPGVPVPTPNDNSSPTGNSRNFRVRFTAPVGSVYPYDVRAPAGGEESLEPFAGPEIIIESGGGRVKGYKRKKKKPASVAKRAPKRKPTRKSASARKGTKAAARRGATKRSAKKRGAKKRSAKKR